MIRPSLLSLADLMRYLQSVLLLDVVYEAGVIGGFKVAMQAKEPGSPETHFLTGPLEYKPDAYDHLVSHCEDLGLVASAMTVRKMKEVVGSGKKPTIATWERLQDELRGRLRDELRGRVLMFIEPEAARYYSNPDLFGADVAARFASAKGDVEEAGKCLAVGRYTACVFHLMRVLEVGLQELGKDLKLSNIEANWQKLLNDIQGAINRLPYTTVAEKEYRDQRSEAMVHLQNVKNAWRNDVMHPRDTYTEDQALDVWHATRGLMRSLAGFL